MDYEPIGTDSDGGVRKRRKAIKQCLFCRKRKLKCDKQKPMCSTCSSRGLSECIYVEKYSHDVNAKELFKSTPNVELLARIKELEDELKHAKHQGETTERNPLCDIYFLDKKGDRFTYYGPTSFRLLLNNSAMRFSKYYKLVWKRLKEERRRFKASSGYSTLQEVTSIELPQKCLYNDSVLNAMCKTLPSYEEIEEALTEFFNGKLYDNFQILNRDKVLEDFRKCFIKGSRDPVTSQHQVIQLIPPNKKNYYCIGIITEILYLVRYTDPLPQSLDMFNKYLTSYITAKVFYVERVQYMMLRYLYRNVKGVGGGDNSHLILLVHSAFASAIHIGLHKDIRQLYGDDDLLKDSIVYLENLWHWILLADIEISFSIGVPLNASDSVVSREFLQDPNVGSYPLLKKVIIKHREVLMAIHRPDKVPNLKNIIEGIVEFLKAEFKPIKFYLEHENLTVIKFTELDFLLLSLSMVSNFSNIRRQFFKELTPAVINRAIQYSLISTSICVTVLEAFYAMDKDLLLDGRLSCKLIPPNLNLSIYLIHKHFPRFISETYLLMGALGTVSNFAHLRINYPISPVFDLPLDRLDIVEDHYVPAKVCSEVLSSLFDRFELNENQDFVRRLKNSCYSFVILIALEKINREMLRNAFETSESLRAGCCLSHCLPTENEISQSATSLVSTDLAPDVDMSEEALKSITDEFWVNFETVLDDWVRNDADEILLSWFKSDDSM